MEKQNRDEKTVFRAAHSVSVLRSEKKKISKDVNEIRTNVH